VRVALRLEELPLILAAFAEGRLRSYSKVCALTRMENVVDEERLLLEAPADGAAPLDAASAEAPSLGERRADALVLMADTLLAGDANGRGGDRHQVVVHVDVANLRDGEGESELADGTPIAAESARRIACDAAIVPLLERAGRPLSIGRKTRSIPPALRRALQSRDRGCRFPGCTSCCSVDAHHIEQVFGDLPRNGEG
jgi:hypothetical protein